MDMGELVMMIIMGVIIFILAIPWIVIIFGPILFFYSLLSAIIYDYYFSLPRLQVIMSAIQINDLKENLKIYINQWPEKVILFARTTEKSGRFSIIIQFTTKNYQWTLNTKGITLLSAIAKANEKLKYQEIPQVFKSNRKFNSAQKNSLNNNFNELFPQGLKNNFAETN